MRRALLGAAVAVATGTEPPRLRQLQVGAVDERAALLCAGNPEEALGWVQIPRGGARSGSTAVAWRDDEPSRCLKAA